MYDWPLLITWYCDCVEASVFQGRTSLSQTHQGGRVQRLSQSCAAAWWEEKLKKFLKIIEDQKSTLLSPRCFAANATDDQGHGDSCVE